MIVFGWSESKELAKSIARKIHADFSLLNLNHFPDGDSYIRFKDKVQGKKVILVQSLHPNPNEKLIDIIFAGLTAKDLGAKEIILVIPYLAYMRQDKSFHFGESISSKWMAKLIEVAGKELITIDPHLHRYKSLNEIFKIKAVAISSNDLISEFIKKNYPKAFLMGPDEESYQWAENISKKINFPVVILKKKRYNSRNVNIKLKFGDKFKGKEVIIIDDIISTGHTMVETVRQLKKAKAKKIICIAVHGIFVEDAIKKLKNAGASKIITTNTIQNPTSKIDVSKIISDKLKKII